MTATGHVGPGLSGWRHECTDRGGVRPGGRGRRDLPRPDPDRHHQLRRRPGPGERKAAEHVAGAARRGRHRGRALSSPSRAAPAWSPAGAVRGTARTRCCCTGTSTSCRPTPRTGRSHPFSGEIQDGYVWGRGAVDMKDFDAMLLSRRPGPCPRRRGARRGRSCSCFTADEEAGGHQGAEHARRQAHRTCSRAAPRRSARSAGSAPPCAGRRLYLIEAAEKGMAWMRLTAKGNAGHGSMRHPDNAVTALAAAVARIGRARVAGAAHPVDAGAAGRGRRARRHRGDPGERRGAGRGVRVRRRGCSAR